MVKPYLYKLITVIRHTLTYLKIILPIIILMHITHSLTNPAVQTDAPN